MPSHVEQPEWLGEAMMNMNKQIVTNTNKESMNMTSHTTLLNNEVVHYYVNTEDLEEGYVGSEEPIE